MSGHNALQENYAGSSIIEDPGDGGTIRADRSPAIVNLVTATAETRALAAPDREGKFLTLAMDVDGGDCVVTGAVDVDGSGNNVATFDAAGEMLFLQSVRVGGAFRWQIMTNVGSVGLA